jgi:hypothetical protein
MSYGFANQPSAPHAWAIDAGHQYRSANQAGARRLRSKGWNELLIQDRACKHPSGPFAIGYADCELHFSTRWSEGASIIDVDSIRVFILNGPEITDRLSEEGWRLVRVHFGWEPVNPHSANRGIGRTGSASSGRRQVKTTINPPLAPKTNLGRPAP